MFVWLCMSWGNLNASTHIIAHGGAGGHFLFPTLQLPWLARDHSFLHPAVTLFH